MIAPAAASVRMRGDVDSRRITKASSPYTITVRSMWPLGKLFPVLAAGNSWLMLGPSASERDRGGPGWCRLSL